MESVSLGDYTVWRVEASKLWPRNMYYRETICLNCVSEEQVYKHPGMRKGLSHFNLGKVSVGHASSCPASSCPASLDCGAKCISR